MSTFEQNGSKNGAAFQPKKNQQGKRDRPHQDAIDVVRVVHVSLVDPDARTDQSFGALARGVAGHADDLEATQQAVAADRGADLARRALRAQAICQNRPRNRKHLVGCLCSYEHDHAAAVAVDAVAPAAVAGLDPRGGPDRERELVALLLLLREHALLLGVSPRPAVLLGLLHAALPGLLAQPLLALDNLVGP